MNVKNNIPSFLKLNLDFAIYLAINVSALIIIENYEFNKIILIRSKDNEFNYNQIKDKINITTVLLIMLSSIIGILVKSIISYILYDLILDKLTDYAFSIESAYKYKLNEEYKYLKKHIIKKQNEDYQILVIKRFVKFARKILHIVKITKHINNSIYSKMIYLKNIGGDISKYINYRFYKLEKNYIDEYKHTIKSKYNYKTNIEVKSSNNTENIQNIKDEKSLNIISRFNYVSLKYYFKILFLLIYSCILIFLIISVYYVIYLNELKVLKIYGLNNLLIALLFSLISFNIFYMLIFNAKIRYDAFIIYNKITIKKFLYFNKINSNSFYRTYLFNSIYKKKLLVIDICNTIYTKIDSNLD